MQIEVCAQKLGGMASASSGWPLQSSSLPLHDSTVGGLTGQVYSHPLAGFLSRSANPGLHDSTLHTPALHPGTALLAEHLVPHIPQLSGSVCRSKPSSI